MTGTTLEGIGVTPRIGIGPCVLYDPDADLTIPEAPDEVDPGPERQRFHDAREAAIERLQADRDRTAERIGEDEAAILDAHLQFLQDPDIIDDVESQIDDGAIAERAASDAFGEAITMFEEAGGLVAERTDDLREVRDRLLRVLLDVETTDLSRLPEDAMLVAPRLGPGDTAQLDPDQVGGFATATGGRTSHAAIMARSLGIPAVVGIGDELLDIPEETLIIINGREGTVTIDPSDEQREAAMAGQTDVEVIDAAVSTTDGREIEVAANIGTATEAAPAQEQGADGIGLFRTEFLFLDRSEPPSEDEQYEAISSVLKQFSGDRVIVRTLDVGGDKPIPYLETPAEENPFLGVRGVRLVPGERTDLFESQLRALLRAQADHPEAKLGIMFPMVATVEELEELLDHLETCRDTLNAERNDEIPEPERGVMIETPASTEMAGELAERLDFLSIGTNDLTQYVMAAARDDSRVAEYNDPLHPPVLRSIHRTVEAGHAGGAWVGMCGEMAGDPEITELLVGLGLDELSLSAVTIPEVKTNVREIDAVAAEELAAAVLELETLAAVRSRLGLDSD